MAETVKPARLLLFGSAAADDKPCLYCFSYAGGTSSAFAAWARSLEPAWTVIGVELAGHGSRIAEKPLCSVQDMASSVAASLACRKARAPFAFYGHSLGALVAFETAKLLAAEEPVSDNVTNSRPGHENASDLAETRHSRSQLMHLFVGAARAPDLPAAAPAVAGLAQPEFLQEVQQRYGGLPSMLFEEPELLEMVLPALRADFRAYEAYAAAPAIRLRLPVTAFYGTEDAMVSREAVQGWSQVTTQQFRSIAVDGGHFFLNARRSELLQSLRGLLPFGTISPSGFPVTGSYDESMRDNPARRV